MNCGLPQSIESGTLEQTSDPIVQPKAMPARAAVAAEAPEGNILIVDDQRNVANAMAALFQKEGYKTIACYTGAEALRQCELQPVAAAILDIHLPDLNGLVLAGRLRQKLGAGRPIIVVSGDTSMENLNTLQHVGAAHFFSKPFKLSHLLARVKELLSQSAALAAGPVAGAGLV